ncbi:Uncharacterised protein [Segatella copri]|nr:Uncharacterised protein [Segatella copri]
MVAEPSRNIFSLSFFTSEMSTFLVSSTIAACCGFPPYFSQLISSCTILLSVIGSSPYFSNNEKKSN